MCLVYIVITRLKNKSKLKHVKIMKNQNENSKMSVTSVKNEFSKKLANLNKVFSTQQKELITLMRQTKEESLDLIEQMRSSNKRTRRTKQEMLESKATPIISIKKEKEKPIIETNTETKKIKVTDIVLQELAKVAEPISSSELADAIEKSHPEIKIRLKDDKTYKQFIYNTAYQLHKAGKLIKKAIDGKSYEYRLPKRRGRKSSMTTAS